ncbi:eCIS core domain-containing protein [Chitinophaga nivalis]|uniref:DUF4157 domain-containing protein n=1 Tax=Chitinophaga nivalis TaxID=2991709 RepID=A0ABT3IP46_9BACT|nr:DUF4157 domain-containing protein [Chitinophaga nivalis]MCW3464580.1 DUF4157 domain-containing protein [Chitinophaga nivalis]MCW3485729.1 DUF4157 domain-containing protein [Chitinophaga nivalis]
MKTSSSRRYRRHRNPETAEQQDASFFNPVQQNIQTKQDPFFQPKLTFGQEGDPYEKEADAVAGKVVSRQGVKGNALQRKEISAVQRKAAPEEEAVQEKSLPDKKEEEKKVQRKGMPEKKEEEKKLQKKDSPEKKEEEKMVQQKGMPEKKEEEKKLQKKGSPDKNEEEKKVQKKDISGKKEEEKIQKKEEPEKKLPADEVLKEEIDEKEKRGKPLVMTKAQPNDTAKGGDSRDLSGQLKAQQQQGDHMSPETCAEMSNAIGADFRNVKIHTDTTAVQLSNELGAQAFTHGNDVYFNSGKYDPAGATGKHLLAHELTHVVQQGAAPAMPEQQAAATPTSAAPAVQREISTPLPAGVHPDEKSRVATFPSGAFTVVVKPDRKARKGEGIKANAARTYGNMHPVPVLTWKDKKVAAVTFTKKLEVETVYGASAHAQMDSSYGRGALETDKAAGNSSLGFHEGNHGTDFIDYVKNTPFPEIVIAAPVTVAEYNKLLAEWQLQFNAYYDKMQALSKAKTDDVTDPVPTPAATNVK